MRPCEQITHACEAAGFVYGNAKTGNGIAADCIVPIIQGTPQPRKASLPLPQIDPQTIAICKKRSPNYGKPNKNGGSKPRHYCRPHLDRARLAASPLLTPVVFFFPYLAGPARYPPGQRH